MARLVFHAVPTICLARSFRLARPAYLIFLPGPGRPGPVNLRRTMGVCYSYRQPDDKSSGEVGDPMSRPATTQLTVVRPADRGTEALVRPGRQLPLLGLGAGADPHSERGVACPEIGR